MNSKNFKRLKICIIGAGRVGSAFCFSLTNAGYNVNTLVEKEKSSLTKISGKLNIKNIFTELNKNSIEQNDIIIISVQDDNLLPVINKIRKFKIDLTGKIFINTSGVHSEKIFLKLKANKNNVASFHPLQTFNKISYEFENILQNIYFSICGGKKAEEILIKICHDLKSNYLLIKNSDKCLFHIACVLSSNYIITILNISEDIFRQIGISKKKYYEIIEPLILNTLKNVKKYGIINSLTGPIRRNDINLVEIHLKNLKIKNPEILNIYLLLAEKTVKYAYDNRILTCKNASNFYKLFQKFKK